MDISYPKKQQVDDQIGTGQMDKETDDYACQLTSAFKTSLEKVELKLQKDQKHDVSEFLHGKTKSVLAHLSREPKTNKVWSGSSTSKFDL